MLSVEQISSLKRPIVWTFHDMWPFCGSEHLFVDDRWLHLYGYDSDPSPMDKISLSYFIWARKILSYPSNISVVCPSRWLASCSQKSKLFHLNPTFVIPNPIDIHEWKPVNKRFARDILSLPEDVKIILFGAMQGTLHFHKGFDLLIKSLNILKTFSKSKIHLVIFGQRAPENAHQLPFPATYMGHLHDNISLRLLYSSSDLLVVPSRVESFGQTASEAHSCGIPVACFKVGGLIDIVDHLQTGYLANPFDCHELAHGIDWILNNENYSELSVYCRNKAVSSFSFQKVASLYNNVYQNALLK